MVLGLCIAAAVVDNAVWSTGQWEEWKTYNHYRSTLSDYPSNTYDQVSSELQEIGVSENDLKMMKSWATSDTNVFSLDKLADTSEIVRLDRSVSDTVALYDVRNLISTPAMCVVLLFGILILVLSRNRVTVLLSMLCAYAILSGLTTLGRLPDRVAWCVIAYMLVSAAILSSMREFRFHGFKLLDSRTQSAVSLGFTAIVLAMLIVPNISTFYPASIPSTFDCTGDSYDDLSGLAKAVDNDTDDLYVHDADMANLLIEGDFQNKSLPSSHFAMHNLSLGGWMVDSPSWKGVNERLGISSPLDALLTRDHTYLIVGREDTAYMLQQYYWEHYGVRATPVETNSPFEALHVYKFVPERQNGAEQEDDDDGGLSERDVEQPRFNYS